MAPSALRALRVRSCSLVLGLLLACGSPSLDVAPPELLGSWRTNAAGYEDRMLEIRGDALIWKEGRRELGRHRIEAIEEVYGNTNKVLLDSQGSGNLLYLPIDKLIQGGGGAGQDIMRPTEQSRLGGIQSAPQPDSRERRTRQ